MRNEAQKPVPGPTRGWVKLVLGLSLALNLAIGGLVLGNALAPAPRPQSRHDLGLGPLAEAMTREDWRAMRPAFLARNPELKRGAAVLGDEFGPVLRALRAEPFSDQQLQAALSRVGEANTARLASARQVIGAYLAGLTPEARLLYADRVDKSLQAAQQRHARQKASAGGKPAQE